MPYCTNRNDIALTEKSYCTVKCASGKSIAEDQRTAASSAILWGSVERVAGRMVGKSTKRFEAMGGVIPSIDRESTQTVLRELHTYQGKLTA